MDNPNMPPHQNNCVRGIEAICPSSNTKSSISTLASGAFWRGGKLEIVFFARGGQGAKSAAEILAQGAVLEGKFVQAFPSFGPERSGAPIQTFLRVSEKEIRTHEPILNPDVVVVLDDTLLETEKITQSLKEDTILIVNSIKKAEELKERLKFSGKIYPVDASGISMEIIGQSRPNTVILGKIIQITQVAKLESIQKKFQEIFQEKIGQATCDKNIEAIKKAYE